MQQIFKLAEDLSNFHHAFLNGLKVPPYNITLRLFLELEGPPLHMQFPLPLLTSTLFIHPPFETSGCILV